MYSVSAASLARQESAFLRPWPALSLLPPLFPPPLCVYIIFTSLERERERERESEGGSEDRRESRRAEERIVWCPKLKTNIAD